MKPGIYDYFARACRRIASAAGTAGDTIAGADGNTAVFRIIIRDGVIQSAAYQCTTCVTLVAFCEHLVELVQGQAPRIAFEISAATLLELHREVPDVSRGRALLAVAALHSAVRKSTEETTIEGRIHFLDAGTHGLIQARPHDPAATGGGAARR